MDLGSEKVAETPPIYLHVSLETEYQNKNSLLVTGQIDNFSSVAGETISPRLSQAMRTWARNHGMTVFR